jgi:hypothetical protein
MHIYAYVVASDGTVREMPVTEELLRSLEQVAQRGSLENHERTEAPTVIGEFLTALKRAMHQSAGSD